MDKGQKVVFYYDDRCGFCSLGANWLRRVDYRGRLAFHPLSKNLHVIPEKDSETAWLYHSGRWYRDSEAIIRGLMAAGFPFNFSWVLLWVPRTLRDSVYRFIARNRYRLLGYRHPVCEREN